MARGAQEIEGLFPGLLDDMVAAGMPMVRNSPAEIHFAASGHVLGTGSSGRDGFTAYLPSRALLEWQIRDRVQALPGVEIVRADVDRPEFDRVVGRVTGVVRDGTVSVPADLVVDASGRGSRLPNWMEQWGFDRPRGDAVQVGVSYASQRVRIPAGMMPEKMVVVGAANARPFGLGMLLHEDGTWMVTGFGVGGAQPPRDFAGICTLADTLVRRHCQPQSDLRTRRHDVGTAGHVLREVLSLGTHNLAPRFMRGTAGVIFPVWTMNAVADIGAHQAECQQPWWYQRPTSCLTSSWAPPRPTVCWPNGSSAAPACSTASMSYRHHG